MSKCYNDKFIFNGKEVEIGYCELNKKEVDYFKDITTSKDGPLISEVLCGNDNPTNINVYLLNSNIYPIFIISSFKVLDFESDSQKINVNLKAKIEGNIPEEENFGTFTTFVNVDCGT